MVKKDNCANPWFTLLTIPEEPEDSDWGTEILSRASDVSFFTEQLSKKDDLIRDLKQKLLIAESRIYELENENTNLKAEKSKSKYHFGFNNGK